METKVDFSDISRILEYEQSKKLTDNNVNMLESSMVES